MSPAPNRGDWAQATNVFGLVHGADLKHVAQAFADARIVGYREALAARDSAYNEDRCDCTPCLLEHLGVEQ